MVRPVPAEGQSSILVVDDQRDSLVAIGAALGPLGLEIVTARSGREALRLLLRKDFALILLDVGMPEMDGFETAAVIRESERHRRTPIVFVTGMRSAEDIKRGYALGAADYVEKPVDAETLRSKAAALVHMFKDVVASPDAPQANILVVDDRVENVVAITGALSSLRENVLCARSGEEALGLLEKRECAVLLLDVVLPGMDGIETAASIRKNPRTRELPIILMSAIAQAAQNVARGYAVGAVDYLFPPVEPAVLRAKVAVFVDLFKKREWLRRHEDEVRHVERAEAAKRLAEERLRTLQEQQAREAEALKARAAEELAEVRAASLAELEQRNQELTALTEELDAFAYSVSHDLRAPVRALTGFSRILLESHLGELGPEAQAHLRRIGDAAKDMGQLIEALLGLARVTRTDLRRERVDLTALGRDVTARLAAAAPERRVDVVIEDGLSAFGDRRLLQAALENLLGNAWKFTGRRPEARIELGRCAPDGKTAFVVRDNGAGFDPKHASKLFQPFRRLHSSADFEGTGIGLATVQRIVRRHGGQIWAEATPNEGAAFFFTLGEAPPTPSGVRAGNGAAPQSRAADGRHRDERFARS